MNSIEQSVKNFEIHHEYINLNFDLSHYNLTSDDILTFSTKVVIIQNYTYLSPDVDNDEVSYKYKIKLLAKLIYNIEFTNDSTFGDIQYISLEKPLIISAPLPDSYRDGFNINIIPKILDENFNLIDNTLYISNFISFYMTL